MLVKKRGLGYTMLCLMMLMVIGLHARAEENNAVLGTLQVLPTDAEVKESPDTDSVTVGTLKAGTAVIVESWDGEWTKVLYQDMEGYISNTAVSSFESYMAENADGLEQEMLSVAEEEQRITEEYELILRQRRTSLIWGIVIAILIVLILGLGVASAVRDAKKEEKRESEETNGKGTEDIAIEEIEDTEIEDAGIGNTDEGETAEEEKQV